MESLLAIIFLQLISIFDIICSPNSNKKQKQWQFYILLFVVFSFLAIIIFYWFQ